MSAATRLTTISCVWLTLACAHAALAQPATTATPFTAQAGDLAQKTPAPPATRPAVRQPSGPPAFHVAGFFTFGYQEFAARETFKATLGTSGGPILGGGGSLTHRSGLFAQVDLTRLAADGQRAFVHQGAVFPLGIPLRVEVRPIEVTFGYKFFVAPKKRGTPPASPSPPAKASLDQGAARGGESQGRAPQAAAPPRPAARTARSPLGGVKPYVGAGFGLVAYRESSEFAGPGDDVDERYTSYHALGGVEIPVWKWFGAAAEVHWSRVSRAFGEAGLSHEFGEDDLGGVSFRIKVTVGR